LFAVQAVLFLPGTVTAAVPAAFCGLIWPRLKNKTQFLVSAIAIAWALLLTPIAPAGIPIITTVLLAVIFGVKK
jgi:predicted branched-subunit amino acid permease